MTTLIRSIFDVILFIMGLSVCGSMVDWTKWAMEKAASDTRPDRVISLKVWNQKLWKK